MIVEKDAEKRIYHIQCWDKEEEKTQKFIDAMEEFEKK
jgi:hypothetical protein